MNTIIPIEHQNQRVLTTQQLSEAYETETQIITNNFNRNKDRYTIGKHYYCLEGSEKREFIDLNQIDLGSKNAQFLYLWTEKGALLHAKSLNTDKAWEVYEHLVDSYFNTQKQQNAPINSKMLYQIAAELEAKEKLITTLRTANAQQTQLIGELQPKADYVDHILSSQDTINISQIAKDYGLSASKLNKILQEERVQYKSGDQWLLYAEHTGNGYTKSETHHFTHTDGRAGSRLHTKWTQKGRLFINNILNNRGIYADMELLQLTA